MKQYIGMDVHSTTCTAVVISPSGKKTKQAVIETSPGPLVEFVRSVRRPAVLVMEEGNQSDWLYEVLSPHTQETLVVQPNRSAGNKDDSIDAERLARLARLNEPGRLIYKKPQLLAGLRHAAKAYVIARRDLTRGRARLKLLLQSRGLLAKSADLMDAEQRVVWIEQLPTPIQRRATLLGAGLDAALDTRDQALEWMLEEARPVRGVHWVKSVPGIGEIRAPLIVAAMISAHRFRTKRQLWRYSGLGVVVRSSSDWTNKGGVMQRRQGHQRAVGLNHDRNPVLKEAFVGAAQQLISRMPNHPLHHAHQARLERGVRPNAARLTLARKIAAIVLAIWKREEVYDPKKS